MEPAICYTKTSLRILNLMIQAASTCWPELTSEINTLATLAWSALFASLGALITRRELWNPQCIFSF